MARLDPALQPRFARMRGEAQALSRAALAQDYDEARFRVHCIRVLAADGGCMGIWRAALELSRYLGPLGSSPNAGHRGAFAYLANRLASGRP